MRKASPVVFLPVDFSFISDVQLGNHAEEEQRDLKKPLFLAALRHFSATLNLDLHRWDDRHLVLSRNQR